MKENKYYSHIKQNKNLAKYAPGAYDVSWMVGFSLENPIWEDDLFFGRFSCAHMIYYFPLESKISTDNTIKTDRIKFYDSIISKIIQIGLFK